MKARCIRFAALMTVAALAVVGPLASAAFAGGSDEKPDAVATLQIDEDNVEVRKAGKDAFRAAKDEQQLDEGDTIRTDTTGKAEVQYDDQSYTRLDESTTFTIVSLTDDEGNRQVEGSLDTGRTWNRAEGLTESDSFEQTGAGATAAVQGTAFMVSCVSSNECLDIGVVNNTLLSGNGGESRLLTLLDTCLSSAGNLCDGVTKLSQDDPLFQIIQEHLLRDFLEHGYGPGPFAPFTATVVVEDGEVVSFTSAASPPAELPPPPTVDGDEPINIADPPVGDADEIVTDEGTSVVFTFNVISSGGQTFIQFTDLPDPTIGRLHLGSVPGATTCSPCVNQGQVYDAASTFTFVPEDVDAPSEETSFSFRAVNEGGASTEQDVPITVTDNSSTFSEGASESSEQPDTGAVPSG